MNTQCVMLIEADLLIRTPLAQYLRDCGFRVVEAFDTAEARDILGHASAGIDTILMDACESAESGFLFGAWIRTHHPNVTVILAGNTEKTAAKAGVLCEEGPALSRPYDHKLVLQEIRRRLAARDKPKL
jgi:DNA-binding response OmpR family regulator